MRIEIIWLDSYAVGEVVYRSIQQAHSLRCILVERK